MIFFCSDLDNTLIYSYKHDIGDQKVPVEIMDEKELSYMTVKSHELLKKVALQKVIIPVTTRSLKQYRRINFGSEIPIKYALAANGGILLKDGRIEKEWFEETRRIVKPSADELEKGIEVLRQDPNLIAEIRKVDELFIFTKSNDSERTVERLKTVLDLDKVFIDRIGVKVYIFPVMLNKGDSLLRLKRFIGGCHTFIAAGDSYFDVPMLLCADIGLCPDTIEKKMPSSVLKLDRDMFTEEILDYVLNYHDSVHKIRLPQPY